MKKESFSISEAISKLDKSLPAVFARKNVSKLLGGAIEPGTLANLSSQGLSPPFICSGRNAIYLKEPFLIWFEVYLTRGIKGIKEVYGGKDN